MVVTQKLRVWLCSAALFALAALLVAACGTSSRAPSASSASATTPTVAAGASADSASSSSAAHPHQLPAGRDIVSARTKIHRPIRGTGGAEINDDNPGRADSGTGAATGPNPCKLVSQAQAQAIVGGPVSTPQEAPLGPTCIYEARGGRESITIAVETTDFAKIKPMIHDTIRKVVAGHALYCGDYGRPTTFVPLAHGQVLNVSASCAVGLRFAEQAVSQLGNKYAL